MFITFEGSEGGGKTTQIRLLTTFLQEQGYTVLATREPGGTPIGEQIRQCLHDVNNNAMRPTSEILLYSASRAQLVGEKILPALAQGHIVICDRYADSTLAYQGYGRGLDLTALQHITHFATGGLEPHLTFFLDVDPEVGLQRRQAGQLEMNRMDLQQQEFYGRVQHGYKELMRLNPGRWVAIDASRPIVDVQQELQQHTLNRLQNKVVL